MPSIFTDSRHVSDLRLQNCKEGKGLIFCDTDGATLAHVAGLPQHVAQATAEAYTRAMRARPNADGTFTVSTDSGEWTISAEPFRSSGFRVRHEDCEQLFRHHDRHAGFSTPYHGTAPTIDAAITLIDTLCIENACHDCECLVGYDNLREAWPDLICADCDHKRGEAARDAAEERGDHLYHQRQDDALIDRIMAGAAS